MDQIKIGLDFGTHQTKICVQRTPDEGHGEPNYEFFQFKDLRGNKHFFLPSTVQINKDDTLSYGYVDEEMQKREENHPVMNDIELEKEFNVADEAERLYDKYATDRNTPEDMHVLGEMLKTHLYYVKARNIEKQDEATRRYNEQLRDYKEHSNVFHYFKQATFIDGKWNHGEMVDPCMLCIWYLAYVIFLLEEQYGTDFSINIGVPTDDTSYERKKRLAVEVLSSAYYLVEDVYHNDLESFLKEKIETLSAKTKYQHYSLELKDNYWINVFPEAYACLISYTSKGKLSEGLSLTADIGGGTTDVSFINIINGKPLIYRYWSIANGLNSMAEKSGFDYSESDFKNKVNDDVVERFNKEKALLIERLVVDLQRKIKDERREVSLENLRHTLKRRVFMYSGGGSTYPFLTKAVYYFSDVHVTNASIWNEVNMKNKQEVVKLSQLLITAYGLSLCKEDEKIKLASYDSLFSGISVKEDKYIREISKDVC